MMVSEACPEEEEYYGNRVVTMGTAVKMPQVPFASCSTLMSHRCIENRQPRQDGKQQAPEIWRSCG